MSRVFVSQDTPHNLAHALAYGDLTILESRDYPLFADGRPVIERLRAKLSDFNPDEDYLLLVGDPVIMSLCFDIIASAFKFVRVLKWDRQATRYVPINIDLN